MSGDWPGDWGSILAGLVMLIGAGLMCVLLAKIALEFAVENRGSWEARLFAAFNILGAFMTLAPSALAYAFLAAIVFGFVDVSIASAPVATAPIGGGAR